MIDIQALAVRLSHVGSIDTPKELRDLCRDASRALTTAIEIGRAMGREDCISALNELYEKTKREKPGPTGDAETDMALDCAMTAIEEYSIDLRKRFGHPHRPAWRRSRPAISGSNASPPHPRTITIKISGHGPDNTDAPTAEDLLEQLRDYLDIFKGVESAIADDGRNAIEWRVVNASKNTPLSVQLESFSRDYATNIDRRVDIVAQHVANGLALLEARPERPIYFTDAVLAKVERTFERVTNGLDLSELDFGPGITPVRVTPAVAKSAVKNVQLAQNPVERPYSELSAAEGFFSKLEKDGHGRSLVWLRLRLNGNIVKCILTGKALTVIEEHNVGDLLRGRRMLVVGTVRYKALGVVSQIDATDVRFFPPRADQLGIGAIIDENFTGGLTTEEYLARLRDGRFS